MCGILLIIISNKKLLDDIPLDGIVEDSFHKRGPDFYTSCYKRLEHHSCFLAESILKMRGPPTLCPSLSFSNGTSLLWNGEIFDGLEIRKESSDTQVLRELFGSCNSDKEVLDIICKIKGPWSMILWKNGKIWFGRDILGRRSLVWGFSSKFQFLLSSLAFDPINNKWEEVPADGVYCIELNSANLTIKKYCWSSSISGHPASTTVHSLFEGYIPIVPQDFHLSSPLQRLNWTLPSPELVRETISNPKFLHSINDNFRTIEGWPEYVHADVESFKTILSTAVMRRVRNNPQTCSNCFGFSNPCHHASIAILFSGGLDSSVIAALAHKFVPENQPIDLLNVAFEHREGKTKVSTFASPDRRTGQMALEELKKIAPLRKWNFVEINVSIEELQRFRKNCIKGLVYPHNTVLDDSIGCACWFAARGQGLLGSESYTSHARVVLVGMGADEQLAGYTRHRAKFKEKSWLGLLEEIALEIDRISFRNLGRDDRVISDSSREARYPFLDEDVLSYLSSLPIWCKANLTLPRGIGEKLLLRLLALSLGLSETASFPKRAIQFGSKIARAENSKEKGHNFTSRLLIDSTSVASQA